MLFALNSTITVLSILLSARTVAQIGMARSTLTTTEADTSISLCAVLINLVELDISLTALVQTQAVTAAGWFVWLIGTYGFSY